MSDPTASRPDMPGYLSDPTETQLLPWAWAEVRLRDAHNYWLATHTAEGGPHLAPVWAVWDGARIFVATGTRSKKALTSTPTLDAASRRKAAKRP